MRGAAIPRAAAVLAAGLLAFAQPALAQTQDKSGGCDPAAPTVALAAQEIAGKWQQVEPLPGASVEIAAASASRTPPTLGELGAESPPPPSAAASATTNFTLHASHDWSGTYSNGKLVFKRKPSVEEMSRDAPDWARQAVAGQIEWRLELEPKLVCGQRVIAGKWFPGRIKIDETTDAAGNVTSKSATAAGDGEPIAIRYEQQRPAIYGVVMLDDQTGFAAQGVPYHPYPYPAPAAATDDKAPPGREEFNPFAFSVYSRAAEIANPAGRSQFQRGATGTLAVPNEHRTLYVYGQGLPRNWTSKITVKPGVGAAGLDYSVLALDTDNNADMDESRRQMFRNGRIEAEKDLASDKDALDLIQHSEAMLIRVDLHSGALPGIKDFAVNDIAGNTRWRLRFGDDRALISFGRDVEGDTDLVDSLFLPERTFIEVKTEVALPVSEIPLRVAINDQRIKWAGGDTLIAKAVPAADDPTHRTYRTATIELVEPGKPFSPLAPGVVYLPAKANDTLVAKLDDEALLLALSRPATVYRTPAALGMMWKDALTRAAKAKGVSVDDWSTLPGQKAAEIVNEKLIDVNFRDPAKASEPLKIGVTVGDLASLLWFRDEFVRRMTVAVEKNLPQITDSAALRGWRTRLQPDAWDQKSAWTYLHVTCPDGSSCPFSNVLSDDFLQQNFKNNPAAADQWMVKAMAEAVGNYRNAANAAIATAQGIGDGNVEGLIGLLGQDCTDEALDLPCGYKALRPLLLPRMMRLADLDNPQRYLWVPDLNARYVTRNLYTLIAAVKAQQAVSSISTQTGLMIVTMLAGPALSEAGMVGEVVESAMSAPGANAVIAFATEIPEGFRAKWEVQFAQGASLVFGQERLSEAVAKRNAWVNGLVSSLGQSIVFDAIALPRVGAELRTARILEEIEALRGQGYKALDPKYRDAFLRSAIDAKVLEATGNAKTMSEFDKRVSAAFDKVAEDMNFRAAATEPMPGSTVIEAKGDPVPSSAEQPAPAATPPDLNVAQQEVPIPGDFEGEGATRPAAEPPHAPTAATRAAPAEAAPALNLSEIPQNTVIGGFTIGQKLGEGVDAAVYRVTNPGVAGCENGCVIKFYKSTRAAAVVTDIRAGEALLADGTGILQLKNLQYGTEGHAYIIQQEIRGTRLDALVKQGQPLPQLGSMEKGSRILFGIGDNGAMNEAQFAFFRDNRDLGKAVVRLYRDLVDHGLAWEDGHLNNVFFEKQADGTWKAGILDQDRLIKFGERNTARMREIFGEAESGWMAARCASLTEKRSALQAMYEQRLEAWAQAKYGKPVAELTTEEAALFGSSDAGPYFPNATFFMEKAFEYKRYFSFDPKTKQFVDGLIKVEDAKALFPMLGEPDRHAPIDVSMPHWWKTSMAAPSDGNVVIFASRAPERGAADASLRMAA